MEHKKNSIIFLEWILKVLSGSIKGFFIIRSLRGLSLMAKTKIAVIGLGGVAQLVHLPILSKLSDVELCAVAEINKNRLNTIADKFLVKEKYTDIP
jgi:hypothetical protein